MSYDAIIIGGSIIDLPANPVDASVFQKGTHPVERLAFQTGGDAINEATVLSHLGAKVKLISKIGDDLGGRFILEHCAKHGIDSSAFVTDPSIDTGINIVLVEENGERNFITSNRGGLRQIKPEDIDVSCFKEARLLSFASIFVFPYFNAHDLAKIFKAAKDQGLILCADVTKRKNGETARDMKEAFQYIDYIFPNLEEAQLLTQKEDPEDCADVLLECGIKHAIIKIGSRGCLIKSKTEHLIVPALPGIHCLDTTGAGDNFAAGFISGLLKGASLEECGQIANATAAKCIAQLGATAWVEKDRVL